MEKNNCFDVERYCIVGKSRAYSLQCGWTAGLICGVCVVRRGERSASLAPGTLPRARPRHLFRGWWAGVGRALTCVLQIISEGQRRELPREGAVGVATVSIPPFIDPHKTTATRGGWPGVIPGSQESIKEGRRPLVPPTPPQKIWTSWCVSRLVSF